MEKLENKFNSFQTALNRLREAIKMYNQDNHPVLLDGTIQRFEFTVELAWKLIKEYLCIDIFENHINLEYHCLEDCKEEE